MAQRSYALRIEQAGVIVAPIAGRLTLDEANGKAVLDLGTATLAQLMAGAAIASGDISSAGLAAKLKKAVISGGAAGNLTLTGIATTNVLIGVFYFPITAGNVTSLSDLTAEFTITAANTINNTSGTATTGGKLLILYA